MSFISNNSILPAIPYYLIVLFPVFLVNARHWGSVVFGLLLICSLFYVRNLYLKRTWLNRNEFLYFIAFYIYFVVCIVSIIFSIDVDSSLKSLEIDARYLFVPLLYVMFLSVKPSLDHISYAFIALAIVSVLFTGYEELVLSKNYGGIYSRLFTGPILTIAFIWLSAQLLFIKDKKSVYAIILSAILIFLLANILFIGSRSSYLVLLAVFTFLFIRVGFRNSLLLFAAFILFIFASYFSIDSFKGRIDQSIHSLDIYLEQQNDNKARQSLSSFETRLQMAKIVKFSLSEYPITGIGKNNYNLLADKHIKSGELHPELAKHSHPHNAYVDVIVNQGLLGLASILFVFLYPLYVYIKNTRKNDKLALIGTLFSISILIFSLTETAVLSKNNFNAVFIVLGTLFFYLYQRGDIENEESQRIKTDK